MPIEDVTDAAGAYRLEGVQPGMWSLVVGDPDNPLARHDNLEVAAGQTWLDPLALPVLHVATVRVKDEQGRAVSGATVTARGTGGGAIDGLTDAFGELRCERLPAGRWRVFASTGDGRRGNVAVEVPLADEAAAIEVAVRAPVPDGERERR
jgi:hypothetical protein